MCLKNEIEKRYNDGYNNLNSFFNYFDYIDLFDSSKFLKHQPIFYHLNQEKFLSITKYLII
jgi:hypothetical protein